MKKIEQMLFQPHRCFLRLLKEGDTNVKQISYLQYFLLLSGQMLEWKGYVKQILGHASIF